MFSVFYIYFVSYFSISNIKKLYKTFFFESNFDEELGCESKLTVSCISHCYPGHLKHLRSYGITLSLYAELPGKF